MPGRPAWQTDELVEEWIPAPDVTAATQTQLSRDFGSLTIGDPARSTSSHHSENEGSVVYNSTDDKAAPSQIAMAASAFKSNLLGPKGKVESPTTPQKQLLRLFEPPQPPQPSPAENQKPFDTLSAPQDHNGIPTSWPQRPDLGPECSFTFSSPVTVHSPREQSQRSSSSLHQRLFRQSSNLNLGAFPSPHSPQSQSSITLYPNSADSQIQETLPPPDLSSHSHSPSNQHGNSRLSYRSQRRQSNERRYISQTQSNAKPKLFQTNYDTITNDWLSNVVDQLEVPGTLERNANISASTRSSNSYPSGDDGQEWYEHKSDLSGEESGDVYSGCKRIRLTPPYEFSDDRRQFSSEKPKPFGGRRVPLTKMDNQQFQQRRVSSITSRNISEKFTAEDVSTESEEQEESTPAIPKTRDRMSEAAALMDRIRARAGSNLYNQAEDNQEESESQSLSEKGDSVGQSLEEISAEPEGLEAIPEENTEELRAAEAETDTDTDTETEGEKEKEEIKNEEKMRATSEDEEAKAHDDIQAALFPSREKSWFGRQGDVHKIHGHYQESSNTSNKQQHVSADQNQLFPTKESQQKMSSLPSGSYSSTKYSQESESIRNQATHSSQSSNTVSSYATSSKQSSNSALQSGSSIATTSSKKSSKMMTIAPEDAMGLIETQLKGQYYDHLQNRWLRIPKSMRDGAEEHDGNNVAGEHKSVGQQDEGSDEEDDPFEDIESLEDSGVLMDDRRNYDEYGYEEPQKKDIDNIDNVTPTNGRRTSFPPRPVLKVRLSDQSQTPEYERSGSAKLPRSVSFSDGRKSGKIIGLHEKENAEEEIFNEIESPSVRNFNNNNGVSVGQFGQSQMTGSALKYEVQYGTYSHSDENGQTDGRFVAVSDKDKGWLEEKSRSLVISHENSIVKSNHHKTHQNYQKALVSSSSPSSSSPSAYSIRHSKDKLINLVTRIEPCEPHWVKIRQIDLSERDADSVVCLKEIVPNLDSVDLSKNQLRFLTGIPGCLRSLQLGHNKLDSFTSFSHLLNLETLDISNNNLDSVSQLGVLRHLRVLKADNNCITNVEGIYKLDSLVQLSLRGNKIREIDFSRTKWNRLEDLNVSRNSIRSVKGIDGLASLLSVNLDHNELGELEIEDKMGKLRILRASDNELERVDVQFMTQLRTLFLDENRLGEVSNVDKLRKLENLSLRDQRGTELIVPSKSIRDVRRLFLSGNPLEKTFLSTVFLNLVYLELAMSQMTKLPEDIAELVPNCRSLNISHTFIDDITPLQGLSRLRRLSVVGARISKIRGVVKTLECLPELEVLDLRFNPATLSLYATALGTTYLETETTGEKWRQQDRKFRRALPSEWWQRRVAYRAAIGRSARSLRILDGHGVNRNEQ